MTHQSLLQQWIAWLDTVPNEFLFLLALPVVVAVAGLLRLLLDRAPRHAPSRAIESLPSPTARH